EKQSLSNLIKFQEHLPEQQWNKPLLKELCTTMADASICGLGQAAPNPILSSIKYFGDEV
ncbi:MAG: NADH-ubiquinone oxidoreductase-F iron-sulfur binding region domain-containing protein, partial [Cycloclasticus pugetii]